MTALFRLVLTLVIGVVVGGAPQAAAQDTVRALPDSVRQLLGCGTFGPTLQRREATGAVEMALSRMLVCPEGPGMIAELWAGAAGAEVAYLESLAGVSVIRHSRVAAALLGALSGRTFPDTVRMRVLGVFLSQLTGEHGTRIRVQTVGRVQYYDSLGRPTGQVDSTRMALFSDRSRSVHPVPIDPALRAELLATLARIASDPSEADDMRIAARDVREVLLKRTQ